MTDAIGGFSCYRFFCLYLLNALQMPLDGPQLTEQASVFNKNFFEDFKVRSRPPGGKVEEGGGLDEHPVIQSMRFLTNLLVW